MRKITLLMMLIVASIGLNAQGIIIKGFTADADNNTWSPVDGDEARANKIYASKGDVTVEKDGTDDVLVLTTEAGQEGKSRIGVEFTNFDEFIEGETYKFTAEIKSSAAAQLFIRFAAAKDDVKPEVEQSGKALDVFDSWETLEKQLHYIKRNDLNKITFEVDAKDGTEGQQQIVYVKSLKIELVEALSNELISKDDTQLSIYPNPVRNTLSVKGASKITSLQIYNITGQEVLRSSEATVNTTSLTKGVYILKASQEDGVISTKRFIKE